MTEEKNQVWTTDFCKSCGLLDGLYKGYCKTCFDKKGMQYDPKDLEDLRSKGGSE
jgi:hypothetical protein